jgi:hypothetical protein
MRRKRTSAAVKLVAFEQRISAFLSRNGNFLSGKKRRLEQNNNVKFFMGALLLNNLFRRGCMATRDSMNELKQKCEDILRFANDQYQESSLQQHYNDDNHIQALQELENAYNDIAVMAHSANSQQREELHRLRLQIQQAQNRMILLNR